MKHIRTVSIKELCPVVIKEIVDSLENKSYTNITYTAKSYSNTHKIAFYGEKVLDTNSVAKLVLSTRLEFGDTQTIFATKLGVAKKTLQRIEKGDYKSNLRLIRNAVNFLRYNTYKDTSKTLPGGKNALQN